MDDNFIPDYTDEYDDEADKLEREEELRQTLARERHRGETGQTQPFSATLRVLPSAVATAPTTAAHHTSPSFSTPLPSPSAPPRPVLATSDRSMRDQTHRAYANRVDNPHNHATTRRPSPSTPAASSLLGPSWGKQQLRKHRTVPTFPIHREHSDKTPLGNRRPDASVRESPPTTTLLATQSTVPDTVPRAPVYQSHALDLSSSPFSPPLPRPLSRTLREQEGDTTSLLPGPSSPTERSLRDRANTHDRPPPQSTLSHLSAPQTWQSSTQTPLNTGSTVTQSQTSLASVNVETETQAKEAAHTTPPPVVVPPQLFSVDALASLTNVLVPPLVKSMMAAMQPLPYGLTPGSASPQGLSTGQTSTTPANMLPPPVDVSLPQAASHSQSSSTFPHTQGPSTTVSRSLLERIQTGPTRPLQDRISEVPSQSTPSSPHTRASLLDRLSGAPLSSPRPRASLLDRLERDTTGNDSAATTTSSHLHNSEEFTLPTEIPDHLKSRIHNTRGYVVVLGRYDWKHESKTKLLFADLCDRYIRPHGYHGVRDGRHLWDESTQCLFVFFKSKKDAERLRTNWEQSPIPAGFDCHAALLPEPVNMPVRFSH
jgi:hypothetical protein